MRKRVQIKLTIFNQNNTKLLYVVIYQLQECKLIWTKACQSAIIPYPLVSPFGLWCWWKVSVPNCCMVLTYWLFHGILSSSVTLNYVRLSQHYSSIDMEFQICIWWTVHRLSLLLSERNSAIHSIFVTWGFTMVSSCWFVTTLDSWGSSKSIMHFCKGWSMWWEVCRFDCFGPLVWIGETLIPKI